MASGYKAQLQLGFLLPSGNLGRELSHRLVSEEEFTSPAPPQPTGWVSQAVPALLVAAVVGLCGLFLQVTKIEAGLATVLDDVRELKDDSKERLTEIERRVRALEMRER